MFCSGIKVSLGDPANATVYHMLSDENKFADTLKQKFPKDKVAVDKFITILKVSYTKNVHNKL